MMYQVYWGQLSQGMVLSNWNIAKYPGRKVGETLDLKEILADFIKSSEEDTFCFILVKRSGHHEQFEEWVAKYNLTDYIRVMTGGITNPIHPNNTDSLRLIILQSLKHHQREEDKEVSNDEVLV